MSTVIHLNHDQLVEGLPEIAAASSDEGKLEMIARRPVTDERELLDEAELSVEVGLVGDNWSQGKANRDCQLTLMNSRAAQLVAQSRDRWALAGDQLYVDFDIGEVNLPAGTRVAIGDQAVVEVTAEPHTGCSKFISRFGLDAMKFVNSPSGRALNLRGINTTIVQGGVIRVGDTIRKIS
ncbi:hypothetical protein [Synoicihabitans lomoniglobus]|uniref:MOSC domain-containing protein n=1 Tax=Synoicihabitans lomoniglobus TaxID=2909285 RepID=A0AAF0CG75_9BACT|nr:hypothetical protein [Opitutaceae bacterium LMO-M01]WED63257.1 hypothetical protein PXH66_13045 [Opitutaceae bacterium LMO-M01]